MKLPVPSLFSKKAPSNYYLALLLRDEKTIAVVLQEIDGKLKIIGSHETFFSTHLEDVPFEQLLETLDKTISKAEEMLPPNIETEKTVFGVKASWVEDKKIKKEYLAKLKKLCDELSLQPIGFMVITEAISHLLTEEEGAPLSAILAEIGKKAITLTLFRAGKILEAHGGPIEDSATKTVDRLLHHFTTEVLPSRILLLNAIESESLAQDFLGHHWSKSIPFLHVPQISVLPEGFDGKAMVYGAAEQMNFSVLDALGDIKVVNMDSDGKTEISVEKVIKEEKKEEKELEKEAIGGKTETDEEKEASNVSDMPMEGENFGFVMDQDITTIASHKPISSPAIHTTTSDNLSNSSDYVPKSFQTGPAHRMENSGALNESDEGRPAFLANVTAFIPNLISKLKLPALPSTGFNKKLIIIPAVLIILLILGIFYLVTVKATVTLHMEAKKIDNSTDITLRTDSGNDLSQKILAAKEVDTSVDGTVSADATGQKEVGDKAKGSITFYNNSDSKKTISSGSTLTSSNDLAFIVDKDVSVASASGDAISSKPGTATVTVTAKNIGSEYNIPSGTKFDLSGTSTNVLAAKNDSAFSGGSKKEVTVVAKKDVDTLTTNLSKQLESQAKDALKGKAGSGQELLPIFISTNLSKKTLDNDICDEAKKVTLKGTLTFTTLSYSTDDLKQLAESALKGKYEQNLSLSDKGISTQLTDIKAGKNNEATATLSMDAGLLPKLNQDDIVQNLTGKSFTDASNYLKGLPQVGSAEIVLSPNIPLLPKLLPRFGKNIQVILQTND
ncbi:hypothetical protein BH09PAT1_BH09PAT1_0680 [soil metagenome]